MIQGLNRKKVILQKKKVEEEINEEVKHDNNKCNDQMMRDPIKKRYGYYNIEVEDNDNTNIAKYFSMTFNFIEEALTNDPCHRVLVHCFMGKSRSSTILCAYIMRKFCLRFVPALDILRKA